jgi:hypothetical protein
MTPKELQTATALEAAAKALGAVAGAFSARRLLARGVSNQIIRRKLEAEAVPDQQIERDAADAFQAAVIHLVSIGHPNCQAFRCGPSPVVDLATARLAANEGLASRSELAALLRQVTQDRDAFADRCVELQRRVTELELENQRTPQRRCPGCDGAGERVHMDGAMNRCTLCGGTGERA